MKTRKLENFIFVGIYSLLVVSALGAMAGTYAWYEYQTRVSTQFYGTAMSRTGNLKMGLVSDVELPDAENYGLTRDSINQKIYWSEEGLSSDTLSYFLSASGYASNKLCPLTTGNYVEGGTFKLRKQPEYTINNIYTTAEKNQYVYIPLVFQLEGSTDFSIKLKDAKVSSENDLKEAIRVNVKNKNTNFNFAPNAVANGQDVVGGTLDLNKDGFIDFDTSTKKELIYGEAENVSYSTTPNQGEEVLEWKDRNAFNGVHAEGTYSLNDDVVFKTSDYRGKSSVLNSENFAISNTAGYAYVDLTIYAEGWASSIIDQNQGAMFNLDLTFTLN